MSDSNTTSNSSTSTPAVEPISAQPALFSGAPPAERPSQPQSLSSSSVSRRSISDSEHPQEYNYESQRRDNMIAMDRKRRLTSSATDSGRRRHTPAGRTIQEIDSGDSDTQAATGSTTRPPPSGVIDLTTSPPMPSTSLPRRHTQISRTSSSSSRRYVIPRWQPDSEVNDCPICHKPFTWLFRRHHCRKCGRVVCSECSPHRITIPRQFIVNPPDLESFSSPSRADGSRIAHAIDLTGDDDDEEPLSARRPYLGGGEKVRLCNPCVPDPQPEPQPNFPSQQIQDESRREQPLPSPNLMSSSRHHTNILGQVSRHQPGHMPNVNQASSVPTGFGPRPAFSSGHSQPHSTANFDEILSRGLGPRPDSSQRRHHSSSMAGSTYANNPLPPLPPMYGHGRYGSLDSRPRMPSDSYRRPRGSSLYAQHMRDLGVTPPVPRAPRPRINEEDMCPICRRALPPKGADGDETQREVHIMECITSRDPATRSGGEGSSSRPGMLHMIVFTATEKDCIGEDGNTTECSICMVEYDPGDELARLECFCKFHKECIVSWLNRKAECPVHKASSMHY